MQQINGSRADNVSESKETVDSLSSLASSFMLALALIYILLMLLFNSVPQPFLILTAILLALRA